MHRLQLRASTLPALFFTLLAQSAKSQEWLTYKPSLKSQVTALTLMKAQSLLSAICTSIIETKQFGLTCETKPLGPAFSDIADNQFHPQGIIFGHFLKPDSEEAVVSGWSIETHPYHWGGALLLTRGGGKWRPVWYKSGLITRSCEKAGRPDGRELLICEYEDGGMGHRYHALNAIDLRHASADTPPIVSADSFDSDFCTMQQQTMEAVHWETERRSFSTIVRTLGWELLPVGYCGSKLPKRPKPVVRMEFEVTNETVRLVGTGFAGPVNR
jgi:hypothetical protein